MKRWNLISGILLAVLGLLVILFPDFWIKLVVILLGLASVAYGIYSIRVTKTFFEGAYYERSILIKSIESIVIGAVAVIFPLAFGQTMWGIMIWLLIISLVVSAVLGFYAAALLKDSGVDRKNLFLENLCVLITAVVLILISPQKLGIAIIRIVGAAAIVAGAFFIIMDIAAHKKVLVVEADSDVVQDAEPSDASEAPVADGDSGENPGQD